MIQPNTGIGSIQSALGQSQIKGPQTAKASGETAGFDDAVQSVSNYLSEVDDTQQAASTSIKDLLAGRNPDITAVVSDMAKADMSFKLLVGVRNKLIEAYKQTMNMSL